MALPSSPPLLPEYEPLTSPPLLPEEPAELPIRPSELSLPGPSRKRQLSDYGSLSSDPLFSEGTSDAEEDDIQDRRRRKRLLRGPWFNLRRVSTQSLRRSMARRERMRNADSGVWMGSDFSDDSIESTRSSRQRMDDMSFDDNSLPITPPSSQIPSQPPTAEDVAAKTIHHCLETGHESVDLSDLGLSSLSNTTLRPLHQQIKHSHADLTQPPSEDEFSPLTPSIQLFLFGNKLKSLPSELFRLTNITVLSLRNNDLADIPPGIGRLSRLQELNIAQNDIRWLPWEMLELMHCRGTHRPVIVRPNPLVNPLQDFNGPSPLPRPNVTPGEYRENLSRWGETSGAFFQTMKRWYSQEDVPWTMRHELELRLKLGRLRRINYLEGRSRAGIELQLCKEQLIYVASSAVRFFNVDGSLCRPPTATTIEDDEERFTATVNPLANQPTSPIASSVPSLFELVLRSVQANFVPTDLHDIADDLPTAVTSAMQTAFKAIEHGDEKCSVCGDRLIIARAEWMEYWFNGFPAQECLTQETVLPFLRRACSWKCARPSDIGAFLF